MELEAQRRCSWRAVLAAAAILCGAFLASGPATADDTAAVSEVLSLTEAAAFLQVDPLVLKDMVRREAIPGRRIGVRWRFSRSALVAWLAGADVETAELYTDALARSGAAGQRTWPRGPTCDRASPCLSMPCPA